MPAAGRADVILDWNAIMQTTVSGQPPFPQARFAHFDDLKRTGRWRRHFATEDAFEEAFRKASADAEKWKQLADGYDRPTQQTI
jgi:hypothetical protein